MDLILPRDSERVLVFAPHPDDEIIGCGGALVKAAARGAEILVIYLTSGECAPHPSLEGETTDVIRANREAEAMRVARVLGFEPVFLRFSDTQLSTQVNVPSYIRSVVTDFRPTTVYLPNKHEAHPDHSSAARIVRDALWLRARGLERPEYVFGYEVWSPLRAPAHILDITRELDRKLELLALYESQDLRRPYLEAVAALATYRGIMGSLGSRTAKGEAYDVIAYKGNTL